MAVKRKQVIVPRPIKLNKNQRRIMELEDQVSSLELDLKFSDNDSTLQIQTIARLLGLDPESETEDIHKKIEVLMNCYVPLEKGIRELKAENSSLVLANEELEYTVGDHNNTIKALKVELADAKSELMYNSGILEGVERAVKIYMGKGQS